MLESASSKTLYREVGIKGGIKGGQTPRTKRNLITKSGNMLPNKKRPCKAMHLVARRKIPRGID